MQKLPLIETRRITFPLALVLDAALSFDREQGGWLWRASRHALTIQPVGDGSIAVQALRAGSPTPETVDRPAAWVAASLLHYCFKRRIPIPRSGEKRIEPVTNAIDLVITTTAAVRPLELTSAALVPPAAVGAAEVPAEVPAEAQPLAAG